jgi:hypothetical protein
MKAAGSPWLPAMVITIGVAIVEAATIIRLVPGVTIIDTGALLVTGFLAGLFAGFHVARRHVAC